MAGLVPAIHVFAAFSSKQDVDARNKCGHDVPKSSPPGLTRWSMLNRRSFCTAAWIAGSSPAMTK